MSTPLFDSYLIVDWSAASRPVTGADSIWWALHRQEDGLEACENPPTRAAAIQQIASLLVEEIAAGRRVLAGFDFPFGYPEGAARVLTGRTGWSAIWEAIGREVNEGAANTNDRFDAAARLNARVPGDGPFWGNGLMRDISGLPRRCPGGWDDHLPARRRVIEQRVRGAQEVWKLSGAGSVGGQALVGIAALDRLRRRQDLAGGIAVWPFEAASGAPIVLAEIYPSLWPPDPREKIKDAGQVRAVAEHFCALDGAGRMAGLLAVPEMLEPADRKAVLSEEAWMLGAGPDGRPVAAQPPDGAGGRRRRAGGRAVSGVVSGRWLAIIGIGEAGMGGLLPAARARVEAAEVIIGGDRHHRLADHITAERLGWPHPFDALIDEIRARRGRRLVILATGDPLWYSIGARIGRVIPADEIEYHPQISAFQWAACRLGWSLADVETLSAHGRPPERILPFVRSGARLLILTAGAGTPGEVARLLADRGHGESRLTVFGNLGGPDESRHEGTAAAWAARDPEATLPAFNTLAVACRGTPARPMPRWGLADDAFESDGRMTGQEVRTLTLARLMPGRLETLWDVGTGCGAVAIEWCRAARDAEAVGIDRNPARLAMARRNAIALGTPRLRLIEGEAPGALAGLPRPDAVFIGGGLSEAVVDACLAALGPGGRLVANAAAVESEALLAALHARHGGTLTRIAVERAGSAGERTGWRPMVPVTQWALVR